jgi:hypothetical protein
MWMFQKKFSRNSNHPSVWCRQSISTSVVNVFGKSRTDIDQPNVLAMKGHTCRSIHLNMNSSTQAVSIPWCKGSAWNASTTASVLNLRASSEMNHHVPCDVIWSWLLHSRFVLSSHDFMDSCYMHVRTRAQCSNIRTPPLNCESSAHNSTKISLNET